MRDVAPPSDPDEEPGFVIAVIRTGGLAGIRRRWHVVPQHDDEPRWIELIDSCPWDDPAGTPEREADRYIWRIQARTPAARLERELPESALDGPWRQLVDAVRASSTS
ncbi:protealysin inhibitor emfourin [Microbacterium murale]|uniref:Uncharacterized protein n=1 Tax=Microbacterium murale TaxID=1081040 RepID=A0ABU0P943_9MICO|nr:protealysin inhibitor emfourin [Microbacterium murale]MDQ0643862.1 hypothetical protein [Microbacterium murale]